MRMGHQLRTQTSAFGQTAVIGFDMSAALALARAGGIPVAAVAALLPIIESAAVTAMNGRLSDG